MAKWWFLVMFAGVILWLFWGCWYMDQVPYTDPYQAVDVDIRMYVAIMVLGGWGFFMMTLAILLEYLEYRKRKRPPQS